VEGLVQIRIEDGQASIRFDLERWGELHSFYDAGFMELMYPSVTVADLKEGPFLIEGLYDRVKDACIGKIDYIDRDGHLTFVTPSVVLLLEDGRLHWFRADPFATAYKLDDSWTVYTGVLPWIDGIVSLFYESELSFETDNSENGAMTIFADDFEGRRFDLRIPCSFTYFFIWPWVCELEVYGYDDALYGVFDFEENGDVTFIKAAGYHQPYADVLEIYKGSYYMSLAEGERYRPGVMVFDLYIDWWIWEGDGEITSPREIKGAYFAEINEHSTLILCLAEGDALHNMFGDIPLEYFYLRMDNGI
jgi:hypothetical protein